MNIKVDPVLLEQRSNEIKTVKTELRNIMENVELLVISVSGSWQGAAERAFSEKILYVKSQFGNIDAFFEDYAELLKNFAFGYEQQEADFASKINLV